MTRRSWQCKLVVACASFGLPHLRHELTPYISAVLPRLSVEVSTPTHVTGRSRLKRRSARHGRRYVFDITYIVLGNLI
jgi:hypothetical protein